MEDVSVFGHVGEPPAQALPYNSLGDRVEAPDNESNDLLAERKANRRKDREQRRAEHEARAKERKARLEKEHAEREARETAAAKPKRIKEIGEDGDAGPLKGPVPVSADQILQRSFVLRPPPGVGPPHMPLAGVQSCEQPFAYKVRDTRLPSRANDAANAADDDEPVPEAAVSTLPAWIRNHPDFAKCVAAPLNQHDAAERARQVRKALSVAPEHRPLSSVLMICTWLLEFTDLPLHGVPRRNLIAMARALSMRRIKKRGKAVYDKGSLPAHVFVVLDGTACVDCSLQSSVEPKQSISTQVNEQLVPLHLSLDGVGSSFSSDGGANTLMAGSLSSIGGVLSGDGDVEGAQERSLHGNCGRERGGSAGSTSEAVGSPSKPQATRSPHSAVAPGPTLGSGRSFGFVSSVAFDEPRAESVHNGCYPWEADEEKRIQKAAKAAHSELVASYANSTTYEGPSSIGVVSASGTTHHRGGDGSQGGGASAQPPPPPPPVVDRPPPLLLAMVPLSLFFEEAAPGLSRWADSLGPFVAKHVRPARRWADSKSFVFTRQLVTRKFMPGDVVWRAGQPADSLSFVLGGSFALTRETLWDVGNQWPQQINPNAQRRSRACRDGATVVLETVDHVEGAEAAALAAGNHLSDDDDDGDEVGASGGEGHSGGDVSGNSSSNATTTKKRVYRRRRLRRCSPVVVGEEPLLLSPHGAGDSMHPMFEETRRYTLRAVGPGVCTLLDLSRNAVRKYISHKGAWAESVQRMAAKRHVTPEEVRLAHRLQHTYDHLSAPEWGPNMQKRRAQHAQAQALQAQAANTIRNAARREKNRMSNEFGTRSGNDGGGSNMHRSGASSNSATISGSRSGLNSKSADSLKPGALLLKTGSHASVEGVSNTADVWSERSKALRETSRVHQGKWSEGLSTPLPMIRAGVPGIQRG